MDDAAAVNNNMWVEAARVHDILVALNRLDTADLPDETEEEDANDGSFNVEGIPTDVIPTDGDELECDTDAVVDMKPKGYVLNVAEAALGEESRALLIWRRSEEESFSDWKIKVVAGTIDDSNETATVYNVHRSILATGPKKSSYFEALFKESSESISTEELSEDEAAQFPHFLDYMYSQPAESKAIVNSANWRSMAFLASHFHVPRLTEDVMDFMLKDMYNLDHMEKYLSEYDRITVPVQYDLLSEDGLLSERILQNASFVCAEMIRSIEVDSSLLKVISPATFLSILSKLAEGGIVKASRDALSDADRNHICDLAITYSERVDDYSYFTDLLDMMYDDLFVYADVKVAGERAITLLSLMGRKEVIDDFYTFACTQCLSDYLSSQQPTVALMNRVVREVPDLIVARLFRESLLNGRLLEAHEHTYLVTLDFIENGSQCDADSNTDENQVEAVALAD